MDKQFWVNAIADMVFFKKQDDIRSLEAQQKDTAFLNAKLQEKIERLNLCSSEQEVISLLWSLPDEKAIDELGRQINIWGLNNRAITVFSPNKTRMKYEAASHFAMNLIGKRERSSKVQAAVRQDTTQDVPEQHTAEIQQQSTTEQEQNTSPVLNEQAVENAYNATVLKMNEMLQAGKNNMPTLWEFHKSMGLDKATIYEVFNRLQEKGLYRGIIDMDVDAIFIVPLRERFNDEVKRITAQQQAEQEQQEIQPSEQINPETLNDTQQFSLFEPDFDEMPLNDNGEFNTAVLDDVPEDQIQIQEINARASWPQNSSSVDTSTLVEFFSSANASSGFHELGHHILRVLTDAALSTYASDTLIQDVNAIFKNAGIKAQDFYSNANNAKDTVHEYFAKAFEVFVRRQSSN